MNSYKVYYYPSKCAANFGKNLPSAEEGELRAPEYFAYEDEAAHASKNFDCPDCAWHVRYAAVGVPASSRVGSIRSITRPSARAGPRR